MRLNRRDRRGQALVEFTLVFPMALLVIFGIIVFGLYIFYQQQLTNVAREAARFAAIHSSSALCPTSGWRDPQAPPTTYQLYPFSCDGPNNPRDQYPWPNMTKQARSYAWGLNPGAIWVNACWSGYAPAGTVIAPLQDYSAASGFPRSDQPPVDASGAPNVWAPCTISRIDPVNSAGTLGCGKGMTTAADDPSSDIPGNQVTVYACLQWTPPLSGFLMMPSTITLRAVITEVIQRQQ
jgi:TadE-like protein